MEKKWCYKAIYPLRCALSTYSKDQSTFTRLHTKFVQICLITKHYREAQKVLEIPLLSVSTKLLDTKINRSRIAHELICYFLYGARAYAALKDFNKSIHFCKLVRPGNEGLIKIGTNLWYIVGNDGSFSCTFSCCSRGIQFLCCCITNFIWRGMVSNSINIEFG